MFGSDEFGNTKLLPIAFALVFAVLSLGVVATSHTMWTPPVVAPVAAAF